MVFVVFQVHYKKDFEESKGRGFSIVSDTPEMQRLRRTQEQISNVCCLCVCACVCVCVCVCESMSQGALKLFETRGEAEVAAPLGAYVHQRHNTHEFTIANPLPQAF